MVESKKKVTKKLELLNLADESKRGVASPEGSELRTKITSLVEEVRIRAACKSVWCFSTLHTSSSHAFHFFFMNM
jgi:hypothetical protein